MILHVTTPVYEAFYDYIMTNRDRGISLNTGNGEGEQIIPITADENYVSIGRNLNYEWDTTLENAPRCGLMRDREDLDGATSEFAFPVYPCDRVAFIGPDGATVYVVLVGKDGEGSNQVVHIRIQSATAPTDQASFWLDRRYIDDTGGGEHAWEGEYQLSNGRMGVVVGDKRSDIINFYMEDKLRVTRLRGIETQKVNQQRQNTSMRDKSLSANRRVRR
jgi:hypothetical protein